MLTSIVWMTPSLHEVHVLDTRGLSRAKGFLYHVILEILEIQLDLKMLNCDIGAQ